MTQRETDDAIPDATLGEAPRRGDDDGFTVLIRRHLRRAMAVALEYTRSRDDAEDVVQAAFIRAWDAISGFDPSRPSG